MSSRRLQRSFFARDTLQVAPDMLGKILVREQRGKLLKGRIVEVEAYVGEDDLACHAAKGRTPRNSVMYGPPGHAYVYLIYGMYQMFNIVTERKDFPAAILVRALEPLEGQASMRRRRGSKQDPDLTNGPGKLTQALQISAHLNGEDLITSRRLYLLADDYPLTPKEIAEGPRIGIDYAQHCVHYPWRFFLRESLYVSR